MFNKEKLALFGYGKTTKAIAQKFGGGCTFFDDNTTKIFYDNYDNAIYPASSFNANHFNIEIATPSLTPQNPLVKKANNLMSEYDFFLSKESPIVDENIKLPFTIWISGTNGKTTTTQMLTHLLKSRGALSGGNIGTPLAELDTKAPIWILETSSFTLHHTHYASPNIYLLLPITPDHLDWHGSSKKYIKDKLKPLTSMQEGELALIPKGLPIPKSNAWIVEYETSSDIEKLFAINASQIKFKGAFLLDSILALAVTKVLFETIEYDLINNFSLDAHRQEELYDAKGRLWVNDSKATNIDAALQAIQLYSDKTLHLLLGGDDKGVDLEPLFQKIARNKVTIYAIGTNASKIVALSQKYNIPTIKADTLLNALNLLEQEHTQDSVALLAPAASSLDQFKSYAQRGDIFKDFVQRINP